jgi:hypothetical protein
VSRSDGSMRRLLSGLLMACLVTLGSSLASAAQSPSPSPSPAMSIDPDVVFPSALDVGDALGAEVETMGIRADMGQLWEGVELEPGAVTAAQMQFYRWSLDGDEDAPAQVIAEIVRFRSADEAAVHGGEVAASITGPLQGFETDLSAELVATGSFTSEEGFGGSTILVREGPVVAIVTAFRNGSVEMEHASTTVTALVLERLSGDE